MGKTSVMRETARRIGDRYLCLHVDLQGTHSAADAIAELSVATRDHQPLWTKTKDIFTNIIEGVKGQIDTLQIDDLKVTLRSGLTTGDWQAKGDRLLAMLAASDQPVVIFCDEVPILVSRLLKGADYQITPERRAQTDAFMSWLRSNSIKHQGQIRLVVTGSIGLEPVLRQGGLSGTVNHLTPFELGPWTTETAQNCLGALANEYGLTFQSGATEQLVEEIGICIPHHVQMFFNYIYQVCKLQELDHVSRDLVAEVYYTHMLSVRGHAELSHLEERLKLVLDPDLYQLALELRWTQETGQGPKL